MTIIKFTKKIIPKTKEIIQRIENYPLKFSSWMATFLGIIALRVLIENWTNRFSEKDFFFFFHHAAYNFIFFTLAYFIFVGLVWKILKVRLPSALNILLWGYLLILFPPIIDHILSGGKGFLSFYGFYDLKEMPRRFLTFFGDRPDFGITYGVRAEIAVSIIFLFFYGILKTKKIWRPLLLALTAYLVLFFLATFPSWLAIIFQGFSKGFLSVSQIDIAQTFLTPAQIFSREFGSFINALSIKMILTHIPLLSAVLAGGFWLTSRPKTLALIKNSRFPQLIYHGGLLFLGAGLAIIFTGSSWRWDIFDWLGIITILESVILAWIASVIFNDLADEKIDTISNTQRPLIQKIFDREEYTKIGYVFFALSIFFSAVVSFKIAGLLLSYQIIAWIYSSAPFRLKRFAYLATFLSAIASLLILFAGFILVSPEQNIHNLPAGIVWLLIIGYTLSLPLKDFRDIEGDKKNGVFTIPVIFGWHLGKIMTGAGIFLSFFLSVWILKDSDLFWWALLFGSAAFWAVVSMKKRSEKFFSANLKTLPLIILTLSFFYILIILKNILY